MLPTPRSVAAIALILTLIAVDVNAQTVFVNGGGLINNSASPLASKTNQSAVQFGARVWLTKHFELQAGATLQSLFSTEVILRFNPLGGQRKFAPYAFAGLGRYLNGGPERSVLPLGIGAAYKLSGPWTINAEISERGTMFRDDFGRSSTDFALSPTLGLSYNFGSRGRKAQTPKVLRLSEAVAAPAENEPKKAAFGEPTGDQARLLVPSTSGPVLAGVYDLGEMVLVPDGMLIMGLADEDPLSLQTAGFKRVTVSSLILDKFEVSNAAYREFLASLSPSERAAMLPDSAVWVESGFRFSWSSYFRGGKYQEYPVVAVTYQQADAYCDAQGKRLPTEAEWEYAARTGKAGGIYPWDGFEPRDASGRYLANYKNGRGGYAADGYAFTAPVDAYAPNGWGLFNMSGNVAEWCEDAYSATYSVLTDFNPFHTDEAESRRVVRGGSWASDAFYIGVGVRDAQDQSEASPYTGFRCVKDVAEDATDLVGVSPASAN